MLDLATGDELWKHDLGEIEMMPARWQENSDVEYTLDNYQPPAFLNERLYLFYEGVTSYDARTGNERTRENFRVNEQGLALTEAAPIVDENFLYTSGRGHVRAVSRASGDIEWEAKDLSLTPEIVLAGMVIYARTGGQFTRLKDGEMVERGAYGVTAIDARNGKILWRYKGADKGITNLVFPDVTTIALANHDELISLDARSGKRTMHIPHRIKGAAFALLNERGEVVIGGQDEVAAFDAQSGQEIWRARCPPPGRGVLRTIAAIAARAASLYFRFGGTAAIAFRGIQITRAASSLASLSSFSWSGLATRSSFSNVQALATNAAQSYGAGRLKTFGVATRVASNRLDMGSAVRDRIARHATRKAEDRLLDRLDPAHQLDRLSRFLWHRERLATLRGSWMYFYTDLKNNGGHGLAGVNIQTGISARAIRLSDLDDRFITDEIAEKLYVAKGNRVLAYSLGSP